MIDLFQFFDPTMIPYANTAVLVAIYLALDRRLRKVENNISRLLGHLEITEKKK